MFRSNGLKKGKKSETFVDGIDEIIVTIDYSPK